MILILLKYLGKLNSYIATDRVAPESVENSATFPLRKSRNLSERNIAMKTLILTLVLISLTFAQTDVIITSVFHSAISGRTEYHRIRDRELYKDGDLSYQDHSKIWHALEVPKTLSAFAVGGVIALDSFKDEFKPEIMLSDLFLAGAIRWIVYDGVYNISQGNDWFHQSSETTSFLEPIGSPYFKIIFLTSAIVFRLIVERL